MTTLAQFARDETFAECHKMVEQAVWAFLRRHGGDVQVLMAEGLSGYVEAHRTFRGDRGALFTSWVRTKVWAALMQYRRKECEYRERWQQGEEKFDWEKVPGRTEEAHFSVQEFLEGLRGDALTLAKLVLESPPEMVKVVTEEDRWVDVLKGMGWTVRQILQAWDEVREALF